MASTVIALAVRALGDGGGVVDRVGGVVVDVGDGDGDRGRGAVEGAVVGGVGEGVGAGEVGGRGVDERPGGVEGQGAVGGAGDQAPRSAGRRRGRCRCPALRARRR